MANNRLNKGNRRYISDNGKIARTRDLTRVLAILKLKKGLRFIDFVKTYGLKSNTLNDALNWLVSHNLIHYKTDQGSRLYFLVT